VVADDRAAIDPVGKRRLGPREVEESVVAVRIPAKGTCGVRNSVFVSAGNLAGANGVREGIDCAGRGEDCVVAAQSTQEAVIVAVVGVDVSPDDLTSINSTNVSAACARPLDRREVRAVGASHESAADVVAAAKASHDLAIGRSVSLGA